MKKIFSVLIIGLSIQIGSALDTNTVSFTTKSGKVFKDAKLISADASSALFVMPSGGGRVKISDLPESVAAKVREQKPAEPTLTHETFFKRLEAIKLPINSTEADLVEKTQQTRKLLESQNQLEEKRLEIAIAKIEKDVADGTISKIEAIQKSADEKDIFAYQKMMRENATDQHAIDLKKQMVKQIEANVQKLAEKYAF